MPAIEIVQTITSGSLLLAIPLAFAAGLVSFLSPCVLPLVPGYLSYITGVAGARATAQRTSVSRSRAVWGSLVFVSGFSVVFISYGALFGGIGQLLLEYQRTIQMIMGVVVVILGLGFLGRDSGNSARHKNSSSPDRDFVWRLLAWRFVCSWLDALYRANIGCGSRNGPN